MKLFTNYFKNSCFFQVAIKIIYLDKGARNVKRSVEDLSREVEIMNEMFGDQKIVSDQNNASV